MQKLEWAKRSDGIVGHEIEVLVQETDPVLNEYGCCESIQYMLLPNNTMYVDKLINGFYASSIDRVD